MKKSFIVKLRGTLFSALEKTLGRYLTLHTRPIYSKDFNRFSSPTSALPPYAVILRGNLVSDADFVLETVRMYTELFPQAPLILSTWKDSPVSLIETFKTIPNVHVVLNDLPSTAGYGHANYQIVCACAGLKKAAELGATYAIIARVDQRMYATDLYPFLYGLLESFPLQNNTLQQKRIVALGYSTIKYRTYSLNDMFFFGTVEDLLLYWDIPHDTRVITKRLTVGDWVHSKVCEGYFLTTFLTKIGHPMHDSLEDYWEALGKYFILVDAADLDWYWKKYARYQEYRDQQYAGLTLGEHVGFKEWLSMHHKYYDPTRIPINLTEVANDTHTARLHIPK